jgi:hypothetical protein
MHDKVWFGIEKQGDWWSGTFTVDVWPVAGTLLRARQLLVLEAKQRRPVCPWFIIYSYRNVLRSSTSGRVAYEGGPGYCAQWHEPSDWRICSVDDFERLLATRGIEIVHWLDFPERLPRQTVEDILAEHFKDDLIEEALGKELSESSGGRISCYSDGIDSRVQYADESTGVALLRATIELCLSWSTSSEKLEFTADSALAVMRETLSLGGIFSLRLRDVSIEDDGYRMLLKSKKKELFVSVSNGKVSLSVKDRRPRLRLW